jgi:hypothetical protein
MKNMICFAAVVGLVMGLLSVKVDARTLTSADVANIRSLVASVRHVVCCPGAWFITCLYLCRHSG